MLANDSLAAPVPPDEADRLGALVDLGVLDTAADPVLDELVALAAELCRVPIVLVSFVDAERQWFKAKVGPAECQTGRDESFCVHAILRPDDILVVPDARQDPRFADSSLVTGEPFVRFYAGVPLVVNGRHPVGTLCIIDTVARSIDPDELRSLRRLATIVVARLEARGRSEALAVAARSAHAGNPVPMDGALLALIDRATAVAGTARSLDEAVTDLLPELCLMSGAEAGRLLLARPNGAAAVPSGARFVMDDAPDDIKHLIDDRQPVTTSGGLVAAVMQSRQCLTARVTDGIAELLVPIVVGSDVCGFVHLPGHTVGELDRSLLATFTNVGAQLGRVVERRRAAAEVEASELAARNVIETSRDAYISVDEHGLVRDWNEAAVEVFGWTNEEAMGRALGALGLPRAFIEHGARELHAFRGIGADRTAGTTLEMPGRRNDGTEIDVEMTIWAMASHGQPRLCTFVRDITDRRGRERRLQEDEARYRSVFSSAGLGIAIVDREGRFVEVNDQTCAITGYERDDLLALTVWAITHPGDIGDTRFAVDELIAGTRDQIDIEGRLLTPTGSVRWVRANLVSWGDDHGGAGFHVHYLDITSEKEADEARAEADARFEAAFENAPIGLALVGLDGRFLRSNGALTRITGYSADQLKAASFQMITHPDDVEADVEQRNRTLTGEIPGYEMDKRYVRVDGTEIWAHLGVSLVRDRRGAPLYFVSQIQDITERRQSELKLTEQATRDALTGLSNRRKFHDELRGTHDEAERGRDPYAIVFVDLDGFKPVNDEHGHEAGDLVLAEVGRRLREISRPADVTARLGGDEFVLLCRDVAERTALEAIVERVRVELARPYRVDGVGSTDLVLMLSASVGGALHRPGTSLEAVMAEADRRMYAAKTQRDPARVPPVAWAG